MMANNERDEVVEELFHSLKNRYQNNLEPMKGSEFVFDYVHLLYYKCHKKIPGVVDHISIFLLGQNQKSNNKSYQ